MSPERPNSNEARVGALMWNLRIDAATGEVVRELREKGVASIVLKGPALSDWYPPDSGRTYADGDIWVAPEHVAAAESLLEELGFRSTSDGIGVPRWWVGHSSSWFRNLDSAKIDLHRRLQGANLEPQLVWDRLWSERLEFTVGGRPAHRLPEPARALYAVLHAVEHGAEDPTGMRHVHAALAAVDDVTWAGALALARELDALDAFTAGLRLTPAGASLADRIGVPAPTSATALLMASTPPSVALGLEELYSARGVNRLEILLRKLTPPPGVIRIWWPPAERNSLMLLVGYGYRALWLITQAPAGYRAWRAARRVASNSS